VNELPSSFNIAWYNQKASFAFPAYLAVDIKDTMINPHLLAHISPDVLNTLVKR
jgi:hydroxylamine reductase